MSEMRGSPSRESAVLQMSVGVMWAKETAPATPKRNEGGYEQVKKPLRPNCKRDTVRRYHQQQEQWQCQQSVAGNR